MEIKTPCVVALTWTLRDSTLELLDELDKPTEFLLGGEDLLPAIEAQLQGHKPGDELHLNLEPEHAFGDYDANRVYLLQRSALPDGVEEGMLIEAGQLPEEIAGELPADHLVTITEIYPKHLVLDGNHPLAGMGLRLHLRVRDVRAASPDEIRRGSAGRSFFRLQAEPPGSPSIH